MAKVPQFREVTGDGEIRLNLHPGQTRVWRSAARFTSMQAGAQGGKTCFGPVWLHREMDEKGIGDYLTATATFPLLRMKMLPELRYEFETLFKWGEWKAAEKLMESHERHHGAPAQRIIVGSATNPESLASGTLQAAWLDEVGQHQFKRDAWVEVQRGLALAQGRAFMSTTLYEFGWYKLEIYDRWKAGDPDYEVVQFDSIMNPAFPVAEYKRAKETLPRWKFNLMYRGIFEKPAGMIYDAFDEAICCIPRFNLPKEWPRYVGHDFGPNNTAAVWYAQDPVTGFLYVYRAYLAGGLSAYDHAQKFKAMSQGETIVKRVGGAHAEDGWREAFMAAGWPISEPRQREVEVGINTVYGWHKRNGLFVFNDVKPYLDEKLSYSRKLDDMYQPTAEIDNKSRFHLMDCERYLLSDFGPERLVGMAELVPVHRNWSEDERVGRRRPLRERMRRGTW